MKSHSIRETDVGKKLIHPHILSHRFSYDKRRGESYMLTRVILFCILYSHFRKMIRQNEFIHVSFSSYWWTVEFLYTCYKCSHVILPPAKSLTREMPFVFRNQATPDLVFLDWSLVVGCCGPTVKCLVFPSSDVCWMLCSCANVLLLRQQFAAIIASGIIRWIILFVIAEQIIVSRWHRLPCCNQHFFTSY
jgi:hypothetical protein